MILISCRILPERFAFRAAPSGIAIYSFLDIGRRLFAPWPVAGRREGQRPSGCCFLLRQAFGIFHIKKETLAICTGRRPVQVLTRGPSLPVRTHASARTPDPGRGTVRCPGRGSL